MNFVDESNVYLGYDMNQSCCEYADWFIADTPQEKYPDNITAYQKADGLDGFVFDKDFFKETDGEECFDAGRMAIFRISDGVSEKFIHIFNSHNGYYGHGFNFAIDGKTLQDGCL